MGNQYIFLWFLFVHLVLEFSPALAASEPTENPIIQVVSHVELRGQSQKQGSVISTTAYAQGPSTDAPIWSTNGRQDDKNPTMDNSLEGELTGLPINKSEIIGSDSNIEMSTLADGTTSITTESIIVVTSTPKPEPSSSTVDLHTSKPTRSSNQDQVSVQPIITTNPNGGGTSTMLFRQSSPIMQMSSQPWKTSPGEPRTRETEATSVTNSVPKATSNSNKDSHETSTFSLVDATDATTNVISTTSVRDTSLSSHQNSKSSSDATTMTETNELSDPLTDETNPTVNDKLLRSSSKPLTSNTISQKWDTSTKSTTSTRKIVYKSTTSLQPRRSMTTTETTNPRRTINHISTMSQKQTTTPSMIQVTNEHPIATPSTSTEGSSSISKSTSNTKPRQSTYILNTTMATQNTATYLNRNGNSTSSTKFPATSRSSYSTTPSTSTSTSAKFTTSSQLNSSPNTFTHNMASTTHNQFSTAVPSSTIKLNTVKQDTLNLTQHTTASGDETISTNEEMVTFSDRNRESSPTPPSHSQQLNNYSSNAKIETTLSVTSHTISTQESIQNQTEQQGDKITDKMHEYSHHAHHHTSENSIKNDNRHRHNHSDEPSYSWTTTLDPSSHVVDNWNLSQYTACARLSGDIHLESVDKKYNPVFPFPKKVHKNIVDKLLGNCSNNVASFEFQFPADNENTRIFPMKGQVMDYRAILKFEVVIETTDDNKRYITVKETRFQLDAFSWHFNFTKVHSAISLVCDKYYCTNEFHQNLRLKIVRFDLKLEIFNGHQYSQILLYEKNESLHNLSLPNEDVNYGNNSSTTNIIVISIFFITISVMTTMIFVMRRYKRRVGYERLE